MIYALEEGNNQGAKHTCSRYNQNVPDNEGLKKGYLLKQITIEYNKYRNNAIRIQISQACSNGRLRGDNER